MDPIRLEAEQLSLNNYRAETQSFASSGALVRLVDAVGSISTTLDQTVSPGLYDIVVVYHDENDGQATLSISVENDVIDTWTLDQSPGGSRATNSNRSERIAGTDMMLAPGTTISLTGTLDAGEIARVDYIELRPKAVENTPSEPSPAPEPEDPPSSSQPPTADPSTEDPSSETNPAGGSDNNASSVNGSSVAEVVRIEAEQMALSGYQTENAGFASGDQLVRLARGSNVGTATTQFSGVAGSYDLTLVYHDEKDGISTLVVRVDGQIVGAVSLNENTDSTRASAGNRRELLISDLVLNSGSVIEIEGVLNQGEVARFDYVELVPVRGGSSDGGQGSEPADPPGNEEPPVNTVPIAQDDAVTTAAGAAVVINVLGNDSDADGGMLNVSSFDATTAANGSVSLNANGTLTYTPDRNFNGNDSFSYSISDGQGGSATARVAIAVSTPPADEPSGEAPGEENGRGTATAVRIEAENMVLMGYQVESAGFASGDQLVRLARGSSAGTATTQFSGVPGDYDLILAAHDENDGVSTLMIRVDGQLVGEIRLNEKTNNTRASAGNRREFLISGLSLNEGSVIAVEGTLNNGELARFDYLDLVPSNGSSSGGDQGNSSGTPTNPGNSGNPEAPTSGSVGQPGVILNLSTGVALAPEFGALESPRILPLGDSITAGEHRSGAVPGGYRIQFWDRSVEDGIAIDFVGRNNNRSGSLADGDHAGFPGRTINQTTDWVKGGNLAASNPQAITLMIGTNDINGGSSATQMIGRLSTLIDEIVAEVPNAYLFVASIPPVDAPRASTEKVQNVEAYNALIPTLVQEKAAAGKRVFFVDAGGSLTVGDINGDNSATNDLNDGLHPTAAGYTVLGDAWYNGVFNPTSLAGQSDLTGTAFDDRLIGDLGNNRLEGAGGQDQLLGGGGADTFAYQSASHGQDVIVDFGGDDLFQISAAGFGGGLSSGMVLDASSFVAASSPVALGSSGVFLYDTATSTLSFDSDGAGGASASALATLTNGHNLQANQISIVA